MKDDVEAAQIALDGGADPKAVSDKGKDKNKTAFDLAKESGSDQVADLLRARATTVKPSPTPQPTDSVDTALAKRANEQLQTALSMGRDQTKSKKVLEAIRGGVTDFTLTDKFGRTALHWAAMKDDDEAAKIALAGGANPKALSSDKGKTPLDLAKASNATKVVALLSSPTPVATPKVELPIVQIQDAPQSNSAANAQLQTALKGKSPLKWNNILSALGGASDFSLTDQTGRTVLHWAAMKDDADAAKTALAGGADASVVSNEKQTALELARERGATKVIALLSSPATAANKQLQAALTTQGRWKARDILSAIRGGATDFSFTSQAGETALHWAAKENDDDAARIVLAGGCDKNTRNKLGQTALELGRARKSAKVVELLSSPLQETVASVTPPTNPTDDSSSASSEAHNEPKKEFDVFISHANEDSQAAIELYEALEAENLSCWLDKKQEFENYTLDIRRGIQSSSTLILLASKAANRPRSGVVVECSMAISREVDIPLYPILIENVEPEVLDHLGYYLSFPTEHLYGFSHPKAKSLQNIARLIKVRIDKEKGVSSSTPELVAPKPISPANQRLQTALQSPQGNRAREVVRAIEGGATDFSFTDNSGRTALHWAVEANDLDAVQKAIKAGADVNATAANGQTPLQLADERKRLWVARELKKYDAK